MMHIAFVVIQNLKCNLIAIYECDFALFFMLPYWYLAQSTAFLMSESQKFLLDQDRIRISFVNIHILHFLNPSSNWSMSLRGICICWTIQNQSLHIFHRMCRRKFLILLCSPVLSSMWSPWAIILLSSCIKFYLKNVFLLSYVLF